MTDCLFCQIINGEKPSHKVYEDEDTYAFLDINPKTKGHTLVVPKKHRETLPDMEKEELNTLFQTVQKVAQAILNTTKATGFTLLQNNGKASNQVVDHVHVQIIPRTENDNLELTWEHEPDEEEFKEMREEISSQLK